MSNAFTSFTVEVNGTDKLGTTQHATYEKKKITTLQNQHSHKLIIILDFECRRTNDPSARKYLFQLRPTLTCTLLTEPLSDKLSSETTSDKAWTAKRYVPYEANFVICCHKKCCFLLLFIYLLLLLFKLRKAFTPS